MAAPGFWENQESAQETVGRLKSVKSVVAPMNELIGSGEDLEALIEMAGEDESAEADVRQEIESLEKRLDELELKALLNGPHDACGAIMTIHARDGGTDANDWAEMLLRMYTSWAQKNDYDVVLFDRNDNDEAGINSASIAIRGPMAYGYLKSETGLHRLVRISPFNSDGKRQTSFAAVSVSPEIDDSFEVEINTADLRFDTYRASGAGGQHVNKTDSAVRITHAPSGIVVQCQSERSQHQNRDRAMKQLKAKLYEMEMQKRQVEAQAMEDSKSDIGWGSQIRSYVLDDQRIKDLRTGVQTSNCQNVLDGDLDAFIEASLKAGL